MTIRTNCAVCGQVVQYTDKHIQDIQKMNDPDQFCDDELHGVLVAMSDVDIQEYALKMVHSPGSIENEYICERLTSQIS
ncbi:MAG: hypothetical protein KKG64_02150 [Firmicutes bacterium]|nr:hypothetical protein [Bacillota bacterium]